MIFAVVTISSISPFSRRWPLIDSIKCTYVGLSSNENNLLWIYFLFLENQLEMETERTETEEKKT